MSATRSRVSSLPVCCSYKVRLASQKIWGRITSTLADKTREFRRKTIHTLFFTSLKSFQPCSNATEQQWLSPEFMARNILSNLGILIRTVLWSMSGSVVSFASLRGNLTRAIRSLHRLCIAVWWNHWKRSFARCGLS